MNQADLVQRVVAEVMRRLVTVPVTRLEVGQAVTTDLMLLDAVITERLLEEKLKGLKRVEVGVKSIVTPAAKDWLRHNQVEWRWVPVSSQLPKPAANRLLISASKAASSQQVCDDVTRTRNGEWRVSVVESGQAVATAVKAIADDGIKTVVVLADEPDVVACLANRNELVRAAVVASVVDIERVQKSLKPNVLVIAPEKKGAFEILRMVRVLE